MRSYNKVNQFLLVDLFLIDSIISVAILLFSFGISEMVSAKTNDTLRPFEEFYPELGYQSAEKALKAFETHFKQDVKIPLRLPPIAFTLQFGRFNNLEGDINDSFEIEYLNDKFPENHYMINIRPVDNGIPLREHNILKIYELKDGNKASYVKISGFNVLVFNKDNWQYMLSIDKKVEDEVAPETLVKIANSIDYPHE